MTTTAMSTKIETPAVLDEDERSVLWRIDCLCRAGYSLSAARKLAECRYVELHQALRIVARGCDPATAVRILQ